jgi:hypothetical protein
MTIDLKDIDPLDHDGVIGAEEARHHLRAALAATPERRARLRPAWALGAAGLAGAAAIALVLIGTGRAPSIVDRASAAVSDCQILYTDTTWLNAGRTIEREERWASCDGKRARHRDYDPSGALTHEFVNAPGESIDWNVQARHVARFILPRQPLSAPPPRPPSAGYLSFDGALDALAKGRVDEAGKDGDLTVLRVRGTHMEVLVGGDGRPHEVRNEDMRLVIADVRQLPADPKLLDSTAPADLPVRTLGP